MKPFSVYTPRKQKVEFELLNQSEFNQLTNRYKFKELDNSIFSYRDDAPAILMENGWTIQRVLPKHYHKFKTFSDFLLCHDKPNFYLVTIYDKDYNMKCYYYDMLSLKDANLRSDFKFDFDKNLYDDQFNVAYVDKNLGFVYFFFKPVRFALYWIENVTYFQYFIRYWKNEV